MTLFSTLSRLAQQLAKPLHYFLAPFLVTKIEEPFAVAAASTLLPLPR